MPLFDAIFHQCTGDEETHLLEGIDKGEQTLCGEGDFCLETVPGTCGELFFLFCQLSHSTLSCRLTRHECRHPFLIDDYTVLTQHRIGQVKGIATCFHWTLNVNKCTLSTKAAVGSSPTLLDSYKHINKQTGVHTIALLWCTPAKKYKNRLTKINGNLETTHQRHRFFSNKCSLLLTLSTHTVCGRGFESPCIQGVNDIDCQKKYGWYISVYLSEMSKYNFVLSRTLIFMF